MLVSTLLSRMWEGTNDNRLVTTNKMLTTWWTSSFHSWGLIIYRYYLYTLVLQCWSLSLSLYTSRMSLWVYPLALEGTQSELPLDHNYPLNRVYCNKVKVKVLVHEGNRSLNIMSPQQLYNGWIHSRRQVWHVNNINTKGVKKVIQGASDRICHSIERRIKLFGLGTTKTWPKIHIPYLHDEGENHLWARKG